ncbi:signal peptide peptidase SppA [bacterium]|nr:signal peptide peptidase SppA [Gammaproteobacteria bacterium]MDC3339946.1 signal peptide peptidase SppA [bacterium]
MNVLKSIFAWLDLFLRKARALILNIGTAFFLIFFVVVFLSGLTSFESEIDPSGRVLVLNPQGTVVDQEVFGANFLANISGNGSTNQIQTRDLIELIRAVSEDDEIPAVLIDFSGTGFAGPTTAINISRELKALRESGKEIIAFNDRLTTNSYLMASQASEVWLHPVGSISVGGLGGMRPYQKELFENLKINYHNYSDGDFKSAVEGNTRADMSENDRLQREAYLFPIWEEMKAIMSEGRGIASEEVQFFADNFIGIFDDSSVTNTAYAISKNIIDGTKSFPEFRRYMIEKFGKDDEAGITTFNSISYQEYALRFDADEKSSNDEVAVITVEGAIMEGNISQGVAGADGIVNQISSAHQNEGTKAIVLRVNSGGGSVIASEMMRDELIEAKRKGIDVVVSMGDVAASGGVYISTAADYIFAEATSITGSIGVAIALPTFENVAEYVGVNFDGVVTSRYGGWDLTQSIDEDLDEIIKSSVTGVYDRFLQFVAESRSQSYEDIRAIAGGRVWIGTAAKELGLVDEIGGINQAITHAAKLSELAEYEVVYYGQEISFEEKLVSELLKNAGVSIQIPEVFSAVDGMLKFYESLIEISNPEVLLTCGGCVVQLN